MICKLKEILLIVFLIYSCNNEKEIEKSLIHNKTTNENWIGSHIIFPKSLVKFRPINSGEKSKLNLVVYYNGDCSVCYLELLKWNKTIVNFRELYNNISFKFILSGNSSAVIKANLENIGFSLNDIYYDKKEEFAEKYHFLLDQGYVNSAMLLDEKDKVLYIGNPTISEKVLKKYIEFIQKNE